MTTALRNYILIQGAASQVGLTITETFIKATPKGCKMRAGYSTDQEKNADKLKGFGGETVKLDLHDKASVDAALKNVSSTVLIPPFEKNREELCIRFIDQCVANGVERLVLISVQGSNTQSFEWAKQMFNIEQKLMGSGLKYAILRSAVHQETFNMQKQAIKEGTLFLPTGDNKFAPVCFKDVAELTQKMLSDPNLMDNKTFEITGPTLLNGTEMARIYSEILGKTVNFVSLGTNDWKNKMKQYDPQEEQKIFDVGDLLDWYGKGNGNRVITDYKTILGREPHDFREYVQKYKDELKA